MIPYYKKYNSLTGSFLATLHFNQIMYWYSKQQKPFYKFLEYCLHPLCREGEEDSWAAELGCTGNQVRHSLKKIGTKLQKGKTYNLIDCGLILYWNGGNGLTYFCPNYPKLHSLVEYREMLKRDFSHFRNWKSPVSEWDISQFNIIFYPSTHFNFHDSYIQESTQKNKHKNTQKKDSTDFCSSSFKSEIISVEMQKEKSSAKKEKRIEPIIIPFETSHFIQTWEDWKAYRSQEFQMGYTSVQEQKVLMEISQYEEVFVIGLIQKAMEKHWRQFHYEDTPKLYEQFKNKTHEHTSKSSYSTGDPIADQVLRKYSQATF